jgi:hypothetical protein
MGLGRGAQLRQLCFYKENCSRKKALSWRRVLADATCVHSALNAAAQSAYQGMQSNFLLRCLHNQ